MGYLSYWVTPNRLYLLQQGPQHEHNTIETLLLWLNFTSSKLQEAETWHD
jgi:hypothetical protein